jgi:tetratricopeptide (TPR) repeat protein
MGAPVTPDSERLKALLAMVEADPSRSFTWYGIAMEYRSLGRIDDAIAAFRRLLAQDPRYVPAYHQLGLTLRDASRHDEARDTFRRGIELAGQVGNTHAQGEMEETLAGME